MRISCIFIALACLLLAAPPAPVLAQDTGQVEYPFAAGGIQTRLIEARILGQSGRTLESAAIYEELLRSRPQDPDVLVPYLDMLIQNGDHAKAKLALTAWLNRAPDNPDALALMARLYVNQSRYEESYPLYDRLAELRPGQADTLVDAAYARLDGGDWPGALDRFSMAVDLNPDNEDTNEALQSLLLQYSPRLDAGFTFVDDQDNAWMKIYDTDWSAQVNGSTRAEAGVTLIQANRKDQGAGNGVDRTLWHEWLKLHHTFSRDWDVMVGAGVHDDSTFGFAQELGLTWRVHQPGQIDLLLERSQPYTDSVDSLSRHMTYDGARLVYTGFYNDQWGLSLAGYATNYCIDEGIAYATRWGVDFSATRRLLRDPDIFVTYTFTRTTRYYSYDSAPVDFAPAEQIHGLSLSVSQRPIRWFSYAFSTGTQKDHFKPQLSYTVDGSATVHLTNRFEWTVGHTYATDAGEAATGPTQTSRMSLRYIF